MLDLIANACREYGVQVVATTHNPAVLAFLDEDTRKHTWLTYRRAGESESRVRRFLDLPDIERILKSQNLGRLHASGWLEDAVAFLAADEGDGGDGGKSGRGGKWPG